MEIPATVQDFYEQLDRCYDRGIEETERFLLDCEADFRDREDRTDLQIAVYNELGSFYRGLSRYPQSAEAFSNACVLTEAAVGRDSIQYATVINNMAGTYRMAGDPDKALELFSQSKEIYEHIGETKGYEYASLLNNMALVLQELQRFTEALPMLEQAGELLKTIPGHRHEMAVTEANLCALYDRLGRKMESLDRMDRALDLFESLSDEDNVHYAAALNTLAGILFQSGDMDRALDTYEKSAAHTKRFFGENMEYGITYRNMSRVYEAQGETEFAISMLEKAAGVFRALFGETDDRTVSCDNDIVRLKNISD